MDGWKMMLETLFSDQNRGVQTAWMDGGYALCILSCETVIDRDRSRILGSRSSAKMKYQWQHIKLYPQNDFAFDQQDQWPRWIWRFERFRQASVF